jgi:probable HAF family extracellular repeat protein
LGTLPGFAQGEATAINDAGQIAGFAFESISGSPNSYRAFVYDGTMHDLGAPGIQSLAEDINASGVVVGESYLSSGWHAFIYSDGIVYDLNEYLAVSGTGWTIEFATGINDSGQIAVLGWSALGQAGAILTPCTSCAARPLPVPATIALLGLGLAGLGVSRRGRAIESSVRR